MYNLTGFFLFLLFVVIPAYYLNKWMLKITRPRESLGRLFLYITICITIAILYSALFIFIYMSIYPLPKK